MSRRQRDRHKALRAQHARWRPTAEQKLEQRLSAGYADMLFRETQKPPMTFYETTGEQEARDGWAPARTYLAIGEPTRNRLIDDLLVGTARMLRERRSS